MFEHGPKRHSYQLCEVKFQCPAKESTVETGQRLSKELARYILPSGGPFSPSPFRAPKEYSNLRLVPDQPTFPLCPSRPRLSPPPSPSAFSRLSSFSLRSFPPSLPVQIKLIFEQRTLLSYEFYRGPHVTHGMEMFSRPTTCRRRSKILRSHPAPLCRLSSRLLSADRPFISRRSFSL